MLLKVLSWLFPVTLGRYEGRHGPLFVRMQRGRKVLDSANANQSFGSLHRVWQLTLQKVLSAGNEPRNVLILGFGGGSLIRILRDELERSIPITAVEMDPIMIELAEAHFALDTTDLQMVLGDAMLQIHLLTERFDLILVDLFDDLDMALGLESRAFLSGLKDRCAEGGSICINAVSYDAHSEQRCEALLAQAMRTFEEVHEIRLEVLNRMFIVQ